MSTGPGLPGIGNDTPLDPRIATGTEKLFPAHLLVDIGTRSRIT